ncbi:hypothetical protein RIF29_01983 [Crotalaria pallida]|uniref:Uncharacterized protein n=1 Tax=Crotalaria pallida TaxID=3830 RepID=A0AAN9IXY0_CROPI
MCSCFWAVRPAWVMVPVRPMAFDVKVFMHPLEDEDWDFLEEGWKWRRDVSWEIDDPLLTPMGIDLFSFMLGSRHHSRRLHIAPRASDPAQSATVTGLGTAIATTHRQRQGQRSRQPPPALQLQPIEG